MVSEGLTPVCPDVRRGDAAVEPLPEAVENRPLLRRVLVLAILSGAVIFLSRTFFASTLSVTTNAAGRVLVVDDEPAIRALVAKIVERAGLSVDTAQNGADAIAKMEALEYAVVVVDMMMPVVDGFGVVEYVGSMRRRRPAVIVISAGDSSVLRQLDGSVVHSILRKPFDIDVLGDLIVAAARGVRDEADEGKSGTVVTFPRPC